MSRPIESTGTSGCKTGGSGLKHVLGRYTIPLPPLAEQRRLVARIDAIAGRVAAAERLRGEADEGISQLCRSLINTSPTPTPMGELVRLREPDTKVDAEGNYHFAGVYCFGRGLFAGQTKSGLEFKYLRLTRLRTGDFTYPKLMAWEGAFGVVPPDCDGLFVSPEFPVFEVDANRVFPEVLDVYFRTPSVWTAVSGTSTGTNARRQRLNPSDFLRYPFPLPPRAVQVALREVVRKSVEVQRLRSAGTRELAALLPAVLDRAFRGEL